MNPVLFKYIVISAVKDEAKYIEETLQSMVQQTIAPLAWIIVDDGSRDETASFVRRYAATHPWIELLQIAGPAARQPGSGVIRAFNYGYNSLKDHDYDFIVKLDCDLRLSPDYFEKILREFSQNSMLGIASGVYLEKRDQDWRVIAMPEYHAAGACKVVRKKCFEQISGFIAARGWDTVDEIRAGLQGWETRHFAGAPFYHLKNEGRGIGFLRTNAMHGEIFYLTGGSLIFFLLKSFHRLFTGKPFLLGGLLMMAGYFLALVKNSPKLVSKEEEAYYQLLLNGRIGRALSKHFRNWPGRKMAISTCVE